MKKLFLVLGVTGMLYASSCVSNPEGEKAATTEATEVATATAGNQLNVNIADSKVDWTGRKVSATHHGDIKIKSGSLTVDGDQLTGGKIVIDMHSMNNLDQQGEWKGKLEGHLKSEDFFNTAQFPDATLEITKVTGKGVGTVEVAANLTIKDVTKNVTFKANVTEATDKTFKANTDFNIKRFDWGITYPGKADDLISEEINFKVNLVANS
ncbi:MAG TPA: YceI family protein [Edaphocola sp.]|nr:YceI family protein [Edaphocola sp.]